MIPSQIRVHPFLVQVYTFGEETECSNSVCLHHIQIHMSGLGRRNKMEYMERLIEVRKTVKESANLTQPVCSFSAVLTSPSAPCPSISVVCSECSLSSLIEAIGAS